MPVGIFKPLSHPHPQLGIPGMAWDPHLLPASHLKTSFIEPAKIQGFVKLQRERAAKGRGRDRGRGGRVQQWETSVAGKTAENFSITSLPPSRGRTCQALVLVGCIIKEQGRARPYTSPSPRPRRPAAADRPGSAERCGAVAPWPGPSQKSINVTVI